MLDTNSVYGCATPGGYAGIARGMLFHKRNESELAGVLAHEISHMLENHALNTML